MRAVIGTGAAAVALSVAATVAWIDVLDDQRAAAIPQYAAPAVEIAPGVDIDEAEVTEHVERITSDPRGWRTDLGHLVVRIVPAGSMGTQRMPGIIGTAHVDQSTAAISDEAWTVLGPRLAAAGGTLDDQRTWIVLHELGHLLAGTSTHTECPAPGEPAPVMRATSYNVGDCTLNVWPNPLT